MPVLTQFSNEDNTYIKYQKVVRLTAKARLYDIGESGKSWEVWFPISQIEDDGESIIAIPTWLAKRKELI